MLRHKQKDLRRRLWFQAIRTALFFDHKIWSILDKPELVILRHQSLSSLPATSCNYMSDCEKNPRFTERTSTNLGRSHRLPHVCTIMIYGKLGGYRLQETAAFIYTYIYIYICDELWIICDIWVSLMWILEKYDDITLKRGIANLGRSHRLPRVFNNFHQFP